MALRIATIKYAFCIPHESRNAGFKIKIVTFFPFKYSFLFHFLIIRYLAPLFNPYYKVV